MSLHQPRKEEKFSTFVFSLEYYKQRKDRNRKAFCEKDGTVNQKTGNDKLFFVIDLEVPITVRLPIHVRKKVTGKGGTTDVLYNRPPDDALA